LTAAAARGTGKKVASGLSMPVVVAVALPVFAIIAAGFVAGLFGVATEDDSKALNRFVFRFGFPAALFSLMAGSAPLSLADLRYGAIYAAAAFASLALAFFIARRAFSLPAHEAGAQAFASVIGNAVFLGLPIAMGVEGWARPYAVLMLFEGLLIMGAGAALLGAGEGGFVRALIIRPLTTPVIIGSLSGALVAAAGLALPEPLAEFLSLLGRAAGPVGLFSIGVFLAARRKTPLAPLAPRIAAVVAVKLLALPGLALALLAAFAPGDVHERGALALFTLTPTAATAYVMASQFGHSARETAAFIAATTMLSLITISYALIAFAP
jgi:hypothetical protein